MNNFAEFLSRFQFGFTACYHIIFPALSIGLAWFLVLIHALYLKTGKADYVRIYKFWTSIFALNFSVGVVTGIFMSFQFGLNWSAVMELVVKYGGAYGIGVQYARKMLHH